MPQMRFEPRLEPPPYRVPTCPCCGWECGTYYLDINWDVIGCDVCFDEELDFDSVADAWEWSGT